MKASIKLLLYFASFMLVFFSSLYVPVDYSYAQLKSYLDSLLTVSAMVFTIMGIWIAFLYPNALNKIVNPSRVEYADFSEALGETKRLEGLVGSVLRSSFVVVLVVFIFLSKIILFPVFSGVLDVGLVKRLVISIVVMATFFQFESIFYVIYSNVMFVNELHVKREEREADDDI